MEDAFYPAHFGYAEAVQERFPSMDAIASLPHVPPRLASNIIVKDGRFILFWPLALRLNKPARSSDAIENIVQKTATDLRDSFNGAVDKSRLWAPVDDPIEHIARPGKTDGETEEAFKARQMSWENDVYGEAVYFHDFCSIVSIPKAGKRCEGVPAILSFQANRCRSRRRSLGQKDSPPHGRAHQPLPVPNRCSCPGFRI